MEGAARRPCSVSASPGLSLGRLRWYVVKQHGGGGQGYQPQPALAPYPGKLPNTALPQSTHLGSGP